MPHDTSHQQALQAYRAELKRSDPLGDVPAQGRTAVAALRLIAELLWIAHQMPTILYPTLKEADVLRCLKLALGKAAYSFEVLCIAYRIDPAQLHVRPKRPHQAPATRSEALADLQGQLLDQCWSHSHAFAPDSLRWSEEIRRHEAAVQLGCTRFVLRELAAWCGTHIVDLLLAHGREEKQP